MKTGNYVPQICDFQCQQWFSFFLVTNSFYVCLNSVIYMKLQHCSAVHNYLSPLPELAVLAVSEQQLIAGRLLTSRFQFHINSLSLYGYAV